MDVKKVGAGKSPHQRSPLRHDDLCLPVHLKPMQVFNVTGREGTVGVAGVTSTASG